MTAITFLTENFLSFFVVVVDCRGLGWGCFRPSGVWRSISQTDPRRAAATAGWETRSRAARQAPARPFPWASLRRSTTSKHLPTAAPREMETPTPNQVSAEAPLCSGRRETSSFLFLAASVFVELLRFSFMVQRRRVVDDKRVYGEAGQLGRWERDWNVAREWNLLSQVAYLLFDFGPLAHQICK